MSVGIQMQRHAPIQDSRVITTGVLPVLLPGGLMPDSAHTQALNLIANIFSFASCYQNHIIQDIIVYIHDYKLAHGVLHVFAVSGLGKYVVKCTVKNMSRSLLVSADLTIRYWIQAKL